jgi:outer membrane protein OmpA-like peptidoglycan-associated protein
MEDWRRDIILTNLSQVNSEKDDYAPAFYQNGIVYASSRRKNGPIDKQTGDTYHDLYYAPVRSHGMRAKPQSFSLTLNSQTHEGPLSFNAAQNTVYFSRSEHVRKSDDRIQMRIYESKKTSIDWEEAYEMDFNNGDFTYMHPSMSPAGDRLYFASNMPGGFGGMDLYMVEWINNRWSRPVNLGGSINTTEDEAFPFIHDSGVLFFSSNGHQGMGGYDLYLTNLSDPDEKVVNLGLPFNSFDDDTGFILDPAGSQGYFSSNRSGGMGKDDIYGFQARAGIPTMAKSFVMKSTIQAVNTSNNGAIPLAAVRVFEKNGESLEENIYEHRYEVDENTGQRTLKKVLKDLNSIQKVERITNRRGEVIESFQAEKDYLILISKDGFETTEFLYSTRGKINPERIEIPVHPQSCFDLSGRVLTSGREPIPFANIVVRNACDGSERSLTANRDGEFVYCLEVGCYFEVVATKAGFDQKTTAVSTEQIRGSRSMDLAIVLQQQSGGILTTPLRTGSTIVLSNIYYDFNAYSIKDGAAKELDELARVMRQYPSMEIELIAYTDSRGEAYYNLELSQKRAQSAKEYLAAQGVKHYRIKSFGFGEARIRNHCTDGVECSEEEHAYNRRTEVKVIRINNDEVEFEQNEKGY